MLCCTKYVRLENDIFGNIVSKYGYFRRNIPSLKQ